MIRFEDDEFIDDKDIAMTGDENKYALKFAYKVKMAEEDENEDNGKKFNEYFIPYSSSTLRENDLISVDEEKILELCSADGEEKRIVSVTIPVDEIKDTDWKNENGGYEETCAFDYIADFVFVSELLKLERKNERNAVKRGILTELMKCKFSQFKIDFSILYIIFNDKNFETNFQNNKSLYIKIINGIIKRNFSKKEIAEKHFNKVEISKRLENDKKKFLTDLTEDLYKNAQKNLLKIYDRNVDFKYLSTVVSVTKKLGNNDDVKKYKANYSGCFCVVENTDNIYFSLSGIKDADYSQKHAQNALFTLIDDIKSVLNKQFSKNVVYCNFSSKVKAYGIKTEHSFLSFPEPILCNQYSRVILNYVYPVCISDFHGICGELYGCCERKIFVKTQNEKGIKIHCRWAPCVKCEKAVFEEINRHSEFEYIALAKNFTDFKKHVEVGELSNMKLWILTKN